jgi:putative aldouronate transport system permease protein
MNKKKDGFWQNTWKHRAHVLMALPVVLILFFFSYVPIAGLCLAFKKFDVKLGLWKSPWVGFSNFSFLTASKEIFVNMTANTLIYSMSFS